MNPALAEHRHQQRPATRDVGDELRPGSTCFPRARTTGTSFPSTPRATRERRRRSLPSTWSWPSTTATTQVSDLMAADEMYDPQFSWPPCPAATKYEVEVNSSVDFAPGVEGLLLTADHVDLAGAYGRLPRQHVLLARPRTRCAVETPASGPAALTSSRPSTRFHRSTAPSIKNMHMRDNLADPATYVDPGTAA